MFAMALRYSVPRPSSFVRFWFAAVVCLMSVMPRIEGAQGAPSEPYKTALDRWRAVDGHFTAWQRTGLTLEAEGTLRLDPATSQAGNDPYPPGGYEGRNFYNGGRFIVGEATSPVRATGFSFAEAIASWNAETPPGTWIETQLRARIGTGPQERWTRWYNMGVWTSGDGSVERHSVEGQRDADGAVSTDTLVLGAEGRAVTADAYQVKVRLFAANASVSPKLLNVGVAVSTTPVRPATLVPGDRALWGKTLQVRECSQMVYPDGGEIWCSPTSMSMILSYWKGDGVSCEARVRAAVGAVFDWVYDGHGNWPFNTAYAATQGLEGYVARFTSFAQAEPWIAAGVPLVLSFSWGKGELAGAPLPSSGGHISVLVGFDANGDPIVNDTAAPSDPEVQRTYKRAELERLWLERSGGTVYLIYPPGRAAFSFRLPPRPSLPLAE